MSNFWNQHYDTTFGRVWWSTPRAHDAMLYQPLENCTVTPSKSYIIKFLGQDPTHIFPPDQHTTPEGVEEMLRVAEIIVKLQR